MIPCLVDLGVAEGGIMVCGDDDDDDDEIQLHKRSVAVRLPFRFGARPALIMLMLV